MSEYEFIAKVGDRMTLDEIYNLQGIIPIDCYVQLDDNDKIDDEGEIVRFIKNVEITYRVIVS